MYTYSFTVSYCTYTPGTVCIFFIKSKKYKESEKRKERTGTNHWELVSPVDSIGPTIPVIYLHVQHHLIFINLSILFQFFLISNLCNSYGVSSDPSEN